MVEAISASSVYVGIRTFRDPTAEAGIKRANRGSGRRHEISPEPTDRQLMTRIQEELTTLNKKRAEGFLTRKEFNDQRQPLKIVYKALMQSR